MTRNSGGTFRPTRRQTLAMTAGALVMPFVARTAAAADVELVLANWGGDAIAAMTAAVIEPFQKETGIRVSVDGSGPTHGKIKAMVESGNTTWNVIDGDAFGAIQFGKEGLLEQIDYSIVDKAKVRPGFAWDSGVCGYFYSYVLAYDSSKFATAPQTWADFWDVQKFPGKRTLWKYMQGALEAALLADGVPEDKLYPLDVDRAFTKLEQLKDHLIFWDASSQSQQLLRDGEVTMGQIWNTRAQTLAMDTGNKIKWSFNHAGVVPTAWNVPKGASHLKETMQFLAFMQRPDRQVALLKAMGAGSANPATSAETPPELVALDAGADVNWNVQFKMDPNWYADNYDTVLNRYLDFAQA